MIKKDVIKKESLNWYDNINYISNIAIFLIFMIIILSQAFAVKSSIETQNVFRNLLNHNSLYLLSLIYFLPLRGKTGRKYINYFNVFLIMIYFVYSLTAVLTVIQSFGLNSIIDLCINLFFLLYMVHSLLVNTRIWKEFKLEISPFNEVSNENYFYTIIVFIVILIAINLIEASTFSGVIISLLSSIYMGVLARYVYLYQLNVKGSNSKLDEGAKDLPRIKSLVKQVNNSKLNGYQLVSISIFLICFVVGIIFGNILPACGSQSNLYTSECTVTQFNFSISIAIWFIGFLVSVFFYGLGAIIELLKSINSKLDKKK